MGRESAFVVIRGRDDDDDGIDSSGGGEKWLVSVIF